MPSAGTQIIPYNEDYSLMIYQTNLSFNVTYTTTADIYSLNGTIGATDTYTGEFNTDLIIDFNGATNTIAKICKDLVIGGYDDWYLPSTNELLAVYNAGYILSSYVLWSSTENDTTTAKSFDASTGLFTNTSKITSQRAIPVRKVYVNDYVTIERMNLQSIQADIEKKAAELDLERQKMIMSDDRERDRIEQDGILRRYELELKYGVQIQSAEIDAAMNRDRELIRQQAAMSQQVPQQPQPMM